MSFFFWPSIFFKGLVVNFYSPENMRGVLVLGVPLEEILVAFLPVVFGRFFTNTSDRTGKKSWGKYDFSLAREQLGGFLFWRGWVII